MATANPNMTERRHTIDRRATRDTVVGTTRMAAAEWIPMLLLIIGGINWGLIGLFDFNLVTYVFGNVGSAPRIVYVLVGISALYSFYVAAKMSRSDG